MGGAFQTSREIFDHPIWQDVTKFRIFFFIVGNAVFSEEGTKVAGINVKRGQFLRSYRNLSEDLSYIENRAVKKYSLSVLKRKIDSLVKENRLKIEESELGTLFTVVNYAKYQGLENYKKDNLERSENRDGTALEQGWNNNKNVKKVKKDLYVDVESAHEEESGDGVPTTEIVQPAYRGGRGQISQSSNPAVALKHRYMQLAAIRGFDISPADKQAILDVLREGIPIKDAMKYLDECFHDYQPKHQRDKINSFGYCATVILNKYTAAKEAKRGRSKKGAHQHSEREYEELSL